MNKNKFSAKYSLKNFANFSNFLELWRLAIYVKKMKFNIAKSTLGIPKIEKPREKSAKISGPPFNRRVWRPPIRSEGNIKPASNKGKEYLIKLNIKSLQPRKEISDL